MAISSRSDYWYPAMAIVSLLLIVWQHQGLNKTLTIFPKAVKHPILVNDHVNGGRSEGAVDIKNHRLQLDCKTIKYQNIFPFCSFMLPLTQDGSGIDLSQYQTMEIWLELSTEKNIKDSILIYLLNQEKTRDGSGIKRSNLRTINPAPGMTHYSLELDSFFVPSWWLFTNGSKINDNGKPDLSNITDLQVSTGDSTVERSESIIIERINLKGKIIATEQLYFFLLACWITAVSAHIVYGLFRLRQKLNRSNLRASELQKINSFLSIEKNKYESMAKIDPLTRALNRAGIRDILDKAVSDFEQSATPCSIILLDIDHFKSVNDNHGHDIGDNILINLVTLIKRNIRQLDYLARWGGEEFVLICPGVGIELALKIAENQRRIIADAACFDPPISCSFGVSELTSAGIAECFKQADIALYEAKGQGRNQVQQAPKSA